MNAVANKTHGMKTYSRRRWGLRGVIILVIGALLTHALILWATESPKIAACGLCGIILIALILTKWRNPNSPRIKTPPPNSRI
jgi:hypothetical protein